MSQKIMKHGLLEAGLAIIYVALVALLMSNGNTLFGSGNNVLGGIAILLLLVFSAAFMGLTIFGRSIVWYLDGQRKEAVQLVAYKLVFILIIMAIIFISLILSR